MESPSRPPSSSEQGFLTLISQNSPGLRTHCEIVCMFCEDGYVYFLFFLEKVFFSLICFSKESQDLIKPRSSYFSGIWCIL